MTARLNPFGAGASLRRAVSGSTDPEFRTLLAADPPQAWRVFIDRHTPTLLALIERAGIVNRDEAMEVVRAGLRATLGAQL